MLQYTDWESLTKLSICNKWKALERTLQLKYLNDSLNKYYGKLFVELHCSNPNEIRKIIPTKVASHKSTDHIYGHITVGKNVTPIRLSTCLDINNSIQFPIEEKQYFYRGNHIFFTCGDMFLMIDCRRLCHHLDNGNIPFIKTKLKNYEIFISDLFKLNDIVNYFGIIDFTNFDVILYSHSGQLKTNIKNIQLNPTFLKCSIRGCITAAKPKYVAARIENSDSITHFEYHLVMTRIDLVNEFKNYKAPRSPQSMGNYARINTDNYLKEKADYKMLIKKGPGVSYIILKYDQINDIHAVRKYCQLFLKNKPKPKYYSLHWAVKKSYFCKSTEEYLYYKKLLIECHGLKDKYSEEDIEMFKCYQIKKFKYKKNGNYNYYDKT